MTSKQVRAKTVYRPQARLEVFYTGGPAHLSSEGLLACACGDAVKVTARRTLFPAYSAGVLINAASAVASPLIIVTSLLTVHSYVYGSVNKMLPCCLHLALQQTRLEGELFLVPSVHQELGCSQAISRGCGAECAVSPA